MQSPIDPGSSGPAATFVAMAGARAWNRRIGEIRDLIDGGPRAGVALRQRHALELTLDRLREPLGRPATAAEQVVGAVAAEIRREARALSAKGRARLAEALARGLSGDRTLVGLFHLFRTAMLHRQRGFHVHHAAFEDDASHDLLLTRDETSAEVVCDVLSAEEGRDVHRGAWFRLADRIDPDLQTWLAAHPGRYLLKMTLPQGLQGGLTTDGSGALSLAALHQRIRVMLESRRRQDHDEAIVLRLDPLLLAGAQAAELKLVSSLRQAFGPEAHLAVITARDSVFVMAARAAREDMVGAAFYRRLGTIAPERLSGQRPGIVAVMVEDVDRGDWSNLRDSMELEGETRRFLTTPEARSVVAVSLMSRVELFGADGEMRFRNPSHPFAGCSALAPSVLSTP